MSSDDVSCEPWQIQPSPAISPIPCGAELAQGTTRTRAMRNGNFFTPVPQVIHSAHCFEPFMHSTVETTVQKGMAQNTI